MWSTGINRNIVECKARYINIDARGHIGINRNIVECKDRRYCRSYFSGYCINRNIVECKGKRTGLATKMENVLIETLWNVKSDFRIRIVCGHSINRNIVECKVHKNLKKREVAQY